jgi:competence protein ComEA
MKNIFNLPYDILIKNGLNILLGVMIGLLIGGLLWLVAAPPRGHAVTLMPAPTAIQVVVQVNGAVVHPGVYTLPQGSRVKEVVAAAGGLLANAAKDQVNQAAWLEDGQVVEIPEKAETNAPDFNPEEVSYLVNINTASVEELDALPGIGPTLAQNIVNYRKQKGRFKRIEDLLEVPGMGPVTFDRIKNLISIED